jgi:D-sedoheptulose 7-phosphate isomerase
MNYFDELKKTISNLEQYQLDKCIATIRNAVKGPGRFFILGNGGSAASANHIACDFQKGLKINCISLSENTAILTAYGNDEDFSDIFHQQLSVLAQHGDFCILLSGSGNSPNCLKAAEICKKLGVQTIGICMGPSYKDGQMSSGKLLQMVNIPIQIPTTSMQVAEDCHMVIGHYMYLELLNNTAP